LIRSLQFQEHHKDQFLELHQELIKTNYGPQTNAALQNFKTLLELDIRLLMGSISNEEGNQRLQHLQQQPGPFLARPLLAMPKMISAMTGSEGGAGPAGPARGKDSTAAPAAPAAPTVNGGGGAAPAAPAVDGGGGAAAPAAPAAPAGGGGGGEGASPDLHDFTTLLGEIL
jgi:hypothetical protein